MSYKSRYYAVFGLTEGADKAAIKHAYRRLAMQYHPDRNPDPRAHSIFLDLTEAYDILMNDRPMGQKTIYNGATNSTYQARKATPSEERMRMAKERLRKQEERSEAAKYALFLKITSGNRWRTFLISGIITAILGMVLLIEPFLPTYFEEHIIIHSDTEMGGLVYNSAIGIETEKGVSMYVESTFYKPPVGETVYIERSMILKNCLQLMVIKDNEMMRMNVDFSISTMYPIFPILFFLPLFTIFYKRNNHSFVVLYNCAQYITIPLALFVLLTDERWLHLLTLGNW